MKIICVLWLMSGSAALPLSAQLRIETGGGQGRLDQMTSSSLTALGGGFDAALGATRLQLNGNAEERFGLGSTGLGTGRWDYRLATSGWAVELGPEGSVAHDIAGPWSHTIAGHLAAERTLGGLSLRADWEQGTAAIGSNTSAWHRPTLSAEFRAGQFRVGAAWQSTINDTSDGSTGFNDSLPTPQHNARDIHDISAHASWAVGPLAMSGQVGRRYGFSLQAQTWWESEADVRLTPTMSVNARTGYLASDILLNLRGAQFTTVGLRLNLMQPAPRRRATTNSAGTQVERETADIIHVWFVLPDGVRAAMVSGDLTEWRTVALSRASDGRWEIVLHANAGIYRINIRTDGGPWRVPPGLAASADDFGNQVGLLVVER